MSEEKQVKETRETRRLRESKRDILNTLLNLYIAERSALKDPEGEEADKAFVKYRNMWITECKNFNKGRNRPITLRGDAFAKSVEFMLDKEKAEQKKANEEKSNKEFLHYMRREQIAEGRMLEYVKRYFFRNLWYNITTLGNKNKVINKWKKYYANQLKSKR